VRIVSTPPERAPGIWQRVQPRLLRAANRVEDAFDAARHRFHTGRGWRIPIRILPYRGFGTPERMLVRGRVVRDRDIPDDTSHQGTLGTLLTSVRRYATHEIPRAKVRVRHGSDDRIAVSDQEGFLDFWWEVEPGGTTAAGWLEVDLELVEPRVRSGQYRGKADVLVVPKTARFGVISDIDDTILQMGARSLLRKFRGLFLLNARERLPFEGVAALYRALEEGKGAAAHNPIFYVSSSPWNVYEHLLEFFALHDLPKGPLFLRDWGLTEKGFAPDGRHEHKLDPIHLLLDVYPELPFILIGDSGQQDAELYQQVCRSHPGRIAAVYIRDVVKSGKRDPAMKRVAASMKELGVPFCLAKDSEAAAQHAASLGFISWGKIEEIVEERDRDRDGVPDDVDPDDDTPPSDQRRGE
jgi:phosphatidate phosphatase APP1